MMGDPIWPYNNSANLQPGAADYNQYHSGAAFSYEYNLWGSQTNTSGFVYPNVSNISYPPPPVAGSYTVPPPNYLPQPNFESGYYPTPPPSQHNYQQQWPSSPNDYAKELETYKYIKSKIEDTSEQKLNESMDTNGNAGSDSIMEDCIRRPRKEDLEDHPEDLDFVYNDCDSQANEIAELYSYTEYSELQYNLSAFEEQMNEQNISYLTWPNFSIDQKVSVIMKILDQLDFSDKVTRMKSARCILYIAQGGWLGIQSDKDQLDSSRESCILLYRLGTFSAFIDLLNIEIENISMVNKSSVSLSDSEDLRVILSVLYTITEVVRTEKHSEPAIFTSFCNEIINAVEDDSLLIKLFNMLTRYCSGSAPHFPVKKVLLLLWKLILTVLGGTEELKELKARKREKYHLPPQLEDTVDVARTMRPSSPQKMMPDLVEEQIKRKRTLVKQTSLEDTESIDIEIESENAAMKDKDNDLFTNCPDVAISIKRNKALKLPWKPKTNKRLFDTFLNTAREKYIGYSLEGDYTTLFGLPKPIHDSVKTLKAHIYTSITELQMQKEEEINRNPLTNQEEIEMTPTEILYQALFPNLPQYMICLLKILLATTARMKTSTDSINIVGDILPKEMPLTVLESMKLGIDVNRHKEIIVKAISAILLLLLKHFKLNHVYQFEFMSQHLVFANCIPLILKFFNQEIINYVKARNSIPVLDFPSCVLGDFQPEISGAIEIGSESTYCWRNVFSSINLLRVLNKLCKWKNSRIMMLVIVKSIPILKRTLKIRHAMAQLYVLKLIKMQSKFLGRNWRKSNLKTISLIYQKVRHHLNDDWAFGNLDANQWDFQAEEVTLRAAVDAFNNRRYVKNVESDFEPADNNLNSALGHDFDLSATFQKNYYLWLEDEVFNNEVHWDKLF